MHHPRVQDLRVIAVDEMDALLDAYPASFGQLMDAAVKRHVPPGFNELGGGLTAMGLDQLGQPDGGSEDGSSSGSTGGDAQQRQDQQQDKQADKQQQDNLAKLKALLSEQQQRNKQQQGQGQQGAPPEPGVPGLPGSSSGSGSSSASLAAAAARLEGLLAAPAAASPGEGAGTQQQQRPSLGSEQQEQQQPQGGAEVAPSSLVASNADAAAAAAAAAGVNLDDDTPMPKPQVILVGATISEGDISLAMDRGWITPEPVVVRVGAEGCVPSGLVHKAIVVSGAQQRLGGLVASLRRDLSGALAAADAAAAAAADGGSGADGSKQPAAAARPVRVIIFARSEAEARSAAEPLRAALWGDHMLSVLLPSTGEATAGDAGQVWCRCPIPLVSRVLSSVRTALSHMAPAGAEPVKAITAFRDRVASLLLCTPSAARGLDLPAVSHVYSIGLPQVSVVVVAAAVVSCCR
jgi:hypothetical protein